MEGAPKKARNPAEQCKHLQEAYTACFKRVYANKFLKGDLDVTDECDAEFEAFQYCINSAVEANRLESAGLFLLDIYVRRLPDGKDLLRKKPVPVQAYPMFLDDPQRISYAILSHLEEGMQ